MIRLSRQFKVLKQNGIIFSAGDPSQEIFILKCGRLAINNSLGQKIDEINAGMLFGFEGNATGSATRSHSAISIPFDSQCILYHIDISIFRAIAPRDILKNFMMKSQFKFKQYYSTTFRSSAVAVAATPAIVASQPITYPSQLDAASQLSLQRNQVKSNYSFVPQPTNNTQISSTLSTLFVPRSTLNSQQNTQSQMEQKQSNQNTRHHMHPFFLPPNQQYSPSKQKSVVKQSENSINSSSSRAIAVNSSNTSNETFGQSLQLRLTQTYHRTNRQQATHSQTQTPQLTTSMQQLSAQLIQISSRNILSLSSLKEPTIASSSDMGLEHQPTEVGTAENAIVSQMPLTSMKSLARSAVIHPLAPFPSQKHLQQQQHHHQNHRRIKSSPILPSHNQFIGNSIELSIDQKQSHQSLAQLNNRFGNQSNNQKRQQLKKNQGKQFVPQTSILMENSDNNNNEIQQNLEQKLKKQKKEELSTNSLSMKKSLNRMNFPPAAAAATTHTCKHFANPADIEVERSTTPSHVITDFLQSSMAFKRNRSTLTSFLKGAQRSNISQQDIRQNDNNNNNDQVEFNHPLICSSVFESDKNSKLANQNNNQNILSKNSTNQLQKNQTSELPSQITHPTPLLQQHQEEQEQQELKEEIQREEEVEKGVRSNSRLLILDSNEDEMMMSVKLRSRYFSSHMPSSKEHPPRSRVMATVRRLPRENQPHFSQDSKQRLNQISRINSTENYQITSDSQQIRIEENPSRKSPSERIPWKGIKRKESPLNICRPAVCVDPSSTNLPSISTILIPEVSRTSSNATTRKKLSSESNKVISMHLFHQSRDSQNKNRNEKISSSSDLSTFMKSLMKQQMQSHSNSKESLKVGGSKEIGLINSTLFTFLQQKANNIKY